MTKSDFFFIADVLRDIRPPLKNDDRWMLVVLAFKAHLKMTFRNFNEDEFLRYVQK